MLTATASSKAETAPTATPVIKVRRALLPFCGVGSKLAGAWLELTPEAEVAAGFEVVDVNDNGTANTLHREKWSTVVVMITESPTLD